MKLIQVQSPFVFALLLSTPAMGRVPPTPETKLLKSRFGYELRYPAKWQPYGLSYGAAAPALGTGDSESFMMSTSKTSAGGANSFEISMYALDQPKELAKSPEAKVREVFANSSRGSKDPVEILKEGPVQIGGRTGFEIIFYHPGRKRNERIVCISVYGGPRLFISASEVAMEISGVPMKNTWQHGREIDRLLRSIKFSFPDDQCRMTQRGCQAVN